MESATQFLHAPLSAFLSGKYNLSDADNDKLFIEVQLYIKILGV